MENIIVKPVVLTQTEANVYKNIIFMLELLDNNEKYCKHERFIPITKDFLLKIKSEILESYEHKCFNIMKLILSLNNEDYDKKFYYGNLIGCLRYSNYVNYEFDQKTEKSKEMRQRDKEEVIELRKIFKKKFLDIMVKIKYLCLSVEMCSIDFECIFKMDKKQVLDKYTKLEDDVEKVDEKDWVSYL